MKVWTGVLTAVLLAGCGFAAEPLLAQDWGFGGDAAKAWVKQAHQCKDVQIVDGVLSGTTAGSDPFLTSPSLAFEAHAGHIVAFRAKTGAGGKGELFWIPAGAKGPQQKWSVSFDWVGDGEWHEYRLRPYWQGEKKIGAVRLDFVNGRPDVAFAISAFRVLHEGGSAHVGEPVWSGPALTSWQASEGGEVRMQGETACFRAAGERQAALVSPAVSFESDAAFIVTVEMAVDRGDAFSLAWASDAVSGLHRKGFRVRPDGQFHTYNVDLSSDKSWTGRILSLQLMAGTAGETACRVRSVRVADDLSGPPDVSVLQAGLSEAINRAGRPARLFVQLSNSGGSDAAGVTLSVKGLPQGVEVASAPGWEKVPVIPALSVISHTLELSAAQAVAGEVVLKASGAGCDGVEVRAPIAFLPDLHMSKADYVPVPRPLRSEYEIGALYYPGWQSIEKWARIWPVAPERKPVLGWYDEANPEVVDWQIKWAVENGLSYFLVDWYWHKGQQHNDHWIKAFKQARYRSYLKWAVMWANHNAAGSHSEADQRAVAKFWIENYFNMPEYYRIDDKPVVMIWSPQNMNRDMGGKDGCRRLLELSRHMAVEAGFKGIYFIAMKWPEGSWAPDVVQGLKDMGFDMTGIYHYMEDGGKAETPRRFSFDWVADSNYAHWKGLHETGILPFLPNLSTGWDDRPWHGDKGREIYGRTVAHFRRICRDAKRFADESGVKRLTLAPLNEWGEGSYAEPCAQFGFGMYEAVRETFCQKPADGWPVNFAPADAGLGPYDLPMKEPDTATDWTFVSGTAGWSATMGIAGLQAADGLRFTTTSRDPALERTVQPLKAGRFGRLVVRMSLSAAASGGSCQLFWSSGGTPTEGTSLSLPVKADGQFHDYVFELGKCRSWRGRICRFRFDPCSAPGAEVVIERIGLLPVAE